ncbi:MAG: DUF1295 domain-containing protein [Myxococcota bacterium]
MGEAEDRGAEHGSLRQQEKDPEVLRHGLVRVVLAYAFALALAAITWVLTSPHMDPLWATFAADMAGTLGIFAFSFAFRNSSFYDAYWSVAPIAVVLLWASLPGIAPLGRKLLVLGLVLWWGARLTGNWYRSWTGLDHEDWRYLELKQKSGRGYWLLSLFGFHLFPTVEVYLGLLACWPALVAGGQPLGALDAVAALVTAGAILIEQVADDQLDAFLRVRKPGEILARGLWKHARHPNYFGEMSFWWGLWLFGYAADPRWAWTIIGPLAISALIVFVSIPMIEARSLARRPGYAEHVKRTWAFLPLPKPGASAVGPGETDR